MLSLRVVVPAHLTDDIVDCLDDDPAVSALSVLRGASLKPAGDVIEADIAREAANDIVEQLRELGVPEAGTVHLSQVDTWMSRAALDAQDLAPGSPADSVVWASVTQQAYDESELNWSYASFMTLATLLAGIAIIVDSPILVIGAMVLGPEFTAIAALGVALVRRRRSSSAARRRPSSAASRSRWPSRRWSPSPDARSVGCTSPTSRAPGPAPTSSTTRTDGRSWSR